MGRPTALNDKITKQLCGILSAGNTIETACAACGISERTYYNWMQQGQHDERGELFQFFQSVYRARAKAKVQLVAAIRRSAPKDWRAAAFLLERSWPDEYARVDRSSAEKAASNGTPVTVNINYDTGGIPMTKLLDFPTLNASTL